MSWADRTGPKGPHRLDPVKGRIAESVQANLLPISVIEHLKREFGVTDVEISVIKPSETMIRVKTEREGIRYFRVKLSEMM